MAETPAEFGKIFFGRLIAAGIGIVLEARIPQGGADVARYLAGNLRQDPEPSAEIIAAKDVVEIEYRDFNAHAVGSLFPHPIHLFWRNATTMRSLFDKTLWRGYAVPVLGQGSC
jgi:hypothetical protein